MLSIAAQYIHDSGRHRTCQPQSSKGMLSISEARSDDADPFRRGLSPDGSSSIRECHHHMATGACSGLGQRGQAGAPGRRDCIGCGCVGARRPLATGVLSSTLAGPPACACQCPETSGSWAPVDNWRVIQTVWCVCVCVSNLATAVLLQSNCDHLVELQLLIGSLMLVIGMEPSSHHPAPLQGTSPVCRRAAQRC